MSNGNEEESVFYEKGGEIWIRSDPPQKLTNICDAMNELVETVFFYAEEETYHAIAFLPDPPCGEFVNDFSLDEGSNYDYEKPGKRARAALDKLRDILGNHLTTPV